MSKEKTIPMWILKDLVEDWMEKDLTSEQAMIILNMMVNDRDPSEEAIDWARSIALKDMENGE